MIKLSNLSAVYMNQDLVPILVSSTSSQRIVYIKSFKLDCEIKIKIIPGTNQY